MKAVFLTFALTALVAACDAHEDDNLVVGQLASDRIELTAEFSEPIVEILVAEGTFVSQGEVLLRQDDGRAVARLAETEAAYQQAKARLDELLRGPRREQIAAARANVEGAVQESEFRTSEQSRIATIRQRGLTSADALDKANAALDAADAALKLRRAQLEELLAGTTVEELAQAEHAAKQAAARRDAAAIDLERHEFRAPAAGIVDSRLFEIGERPGVGQPVLILLGGQQPHARVYIPELLRARIAPGMPASIKVDGLATPVAGKVRWVAAESSFTPYFALTERDRARLSFVAKIDVDEKRERLPDGVPVEVSFDLE